MSDAKFSFHPFTASETVSFEKCLADIRSLADVIGTSLSVDGQASDLDILEDILRRLEWPKDKYAIICTGLAFGVCLASAAKLSWGQVKDDWGEEMSLKLPGYQYFIHPVGIITKRLEDREEIDLHYLYSELLRRIREDGSRQMPDRN